MKGVEEIVDVMEEKQLREHLSTYEKGDYSAEIMIQDYRENLDWYEKGKAKILYDFNGVDVKDNVVRKRQDKWFGRYEYEESELELMVRAYDHAREVVDGVEAYFSQGGC